MSTAETKTMSQAAQCAKAIRAELSNAFPGTKFLAKSKIYSGGCSVTVRWSDGPTTEAVSKLTGKYQRGHFDGMTDCYEYSNKRDDVPQVKFVFTTRARNAEVAK